MVPGSIRQYLYEASATGWIVSDHPKREALFGFLVFEAGSPSPLLWTGDTQFKFFGDWRLQRWNEKMRAFEPAKSQDLRSLQRYVGVSAVMAKIEFPAGIGGERGGEELWRHPAVVTRKIAVEVNGVQGALEALLGEPLCHDMREPFGEFVPEIASDAALALSLLRIDERFREYDRAIFSRRKGGPFLGALGGPSLNAFSDLALQNSIRIARELTRRYPQVADGWWVLAKLAEWAIHKGKGVGRLLSDPTDGLMPKPSEEGMRALEKLFEIRGWAGQENLSQKLRGSRENPFPSEEYWDHRYTSELYKRLRDKKIDREALGKHFGTRPNATEGLAYASPELSSFRP